MITYLLLSFGVVVLFGGTSYSEVRRQRERKRRELLEAAIPKLTCRACGKSLGVLDVKELAYGAKVCVDCEISIAREMAAIRPKWFDHPLPEDAVQCLYCEAYNSVKAAKCAYCGSGAHDERTSVKNLVAPPVALNFTPPKTRYLGKCRWCEELVVEQADLCDHCILTGPPNHCWKCHEGIPVIGPQYCDNCNPKKSFVALVAPEPRNNSVLVKAIEHDLNDTD